MRILKNLLLVFTLLLAAQGVAYATDRVVGDSIAEGSGANSPAWNNGWAGQLGAALSTTMVDVAHGGDMVADGVKKMFANTVGAGDRTFIYVRTNDQRIYGAYDAITNPNAAAKQAYSDNGLRAMLVWYATGSKTLAKNGGVESGSSWTNTVVHGVGRRATAIGDSKTFTVSSGATVAYLSALSATGSGCTYHVKKNGTLIGTYNSDTAGTATYNGYNYNNRLHRIAGVAGGDLISYEMAGPSYCYIEWFADNAQPVKPKVFVGNVIRAAPGYSWGGSEANVQSYNAALATMVSELQADGLDVTLVDLYSVVNDSTNATTGHLHSDGLHPSQLGHNVMKDAYLAAVNGGTPPPPPPPTITFSNAQTYRRMNNGVHDGTFWIDGGSGCPHSTCKQVSTVP